MGSIGHPENWVPYENIKDCSQGFCTMYCPQWCYISYPPPPPFGLLPDDDSGTSFSPLVIAIIGILASAFLLVTYYTVISKYCGNMDSLRRRNNRNRTDDSIENENLPNQEPWQVSNSGLDESLIKSITVCKYKRGDGLIEGTDCSVCLSEFQENESLRLLPKCSHAFHVSCIDTWLKSHANCPLCRSNIVCSSPSPLQTLHTLHEIPSDIECEGENHSRNAVEDSILNTSVQETNSLRNLRELEEINDTTIEIRDEGFDSQQIRRSISMDSSRVDRLSIADILCISENDESLPAEHNNCIQEGMVSSSKQNLCGINKLVSHQSRVLHCVMSPITMKRSVSSGRYFFNTTRHGKSRINFDLPI